MIEWLLIVFLSSALYASVTGQLNNNVDEDADLR
jgi:hypothetical protein